MATSPYPGLNDNHFAGLLQVATAAADAQNRSASAIGKRKRDDEAYIDHQLRTPTVDVLQQDDLHHVPTLQSSAAVLFREPSEKSKKYSRPPLGKVYTDLELPPELFLQLQSAAKAFMLDPAFPERKNVVGQKKQNGNNDIAKLKLWNCVEQFLSTPHEKTGEPNSDYYFGHNAGAGIPTAPVRTFFWPEHRDQVIKMCMPLFRKMVTNERQRLYASETRKSDANKPEKSKSGEPPDEMEDMKYSGGVEQSQSNNMFLAQPSQALTQNHVVLHINVVRKDADNQSRRVAPRFSITADAASSRDALIAEIQKHHDITQYHGSETLDPTALTIKVWLEHGLVVVRDEAQWMVALLSSGTVDWMDGELRVLVEV